MIGEETEWAAVEYHRAHHRLLRFLEFADHLLQADHRVLALERRTKIDLDRLELFEQRPGVAARFVKDVVDLVPRSPHYLRAFRRSNGCVLVHRRVALQLDLPIARGQTLRQSAEARRDEIEVVR